MSNPFNTLSATSNILNTLTSYTAPPANTDGSAASGLDNLRAMSDHMSAKVMAYQLAARIQDGEQTVLNTIMQAQNGVKEAAANAISKGQQIAASIR